MKGGRASDGECRFLRSNPRRLGLSVGSLPPSPFSHPALVIRGRERDANCVFLTTHVVSIKREIGHLCHDENKPSKPNAPQSPAAMALQATPVSTPGMSTIIYFVWPHHISPCALRPRLSFLRTTEYVWQSFLPPIFPRAAAAALVVCEPDPDAEWL
jgi:hypothetical protein